MFRVGVARQDDRRVTGPCEQRLETLELPRPRTSWMADGVHLIAGGTGSLGLDLAGHVARRHGAAVALLSRRPPDDAQRHRIAKIERLGVRVQHAIGDLTNPESLSGAIEAARARSGPLGRVVHAALSLAPRRLVDMSDDDLVSVLAPKTRGLVLLRRELARVGADLVVVFSSTQSLRGDPEYGHYAAASTFQDADGGEWARSGSLPVKTVNWGYWRRAPDGGTQDRILAALGAGALDSGEGFEILDRLIDSDVDRLVALRAGPGILETLGVGVGVERRSSRQLVIVKISLVS
jgi:hypothetical protein